MFTLNEIKERLETGPHTKAQSQDLRWYSKFEVGIEELEVERLESNLAKSASSPDYDIRNDFSFYSPTCHDIHVKVWHTYGCCRTEFTLFFCLLFLHEVMLESKNRLRECLLVRWYSLEIVSTRVVVVVVVVVVCCFCFLLFFIVFVLFLQKFSVSQFPCLCELPVLVRFSQK